MPYTGLDPLEFEDCCDRFNSFNTEISIKPDSEDIDTSKINTKDIFPDEISEKETLIKNKCDICGTDKISR